MNEKNGYVELRNINKNFGDFQASKDINISISRGKLAALLGPSGSGKTTILRMTAKSSMMSPAVRGGSDLSFRATPFSAI